MNLVIKKKKLKMGQSLIEVLLALTITAVILGAITTSVIFSLRNAQFAKNQNLATQFSSQGMEIVKQIRDTEASLEAYANSTQCLGTNGKLEFLVNCGQNVGAYSRSVKIEDANPECTAADTYYVVVSVSWWDNSCTDPTDFCHKVKLASCLVKQIGTIETLDE